MVKGKQRTAQGRWWIKKKKVRTDRLTGKNCPQSMTPPWEEQKDVWTVHRVDYTRIGSGIVEASKWKCEDGHAEEVDRITIRKVPRGTARQRRLFPVKSEPLPPEKLAREGSAMRQEMERIQ